MVSEQRGNNYNSIYSIKRNVCIIGVNIRLKGMELFNKTCTLSEQLMSEFCISV